MIMNDMSDMKIIDEIAGCYKNKGLSLSILEDKLELSNETLREIQLSDGKKPGNKC